MVTVRSSTDALELLDVHERDALRPARRCFDGRERVHVHDRLGSGLCDHGRVHGCLRTGSSALARESLASHIDEHSVRHLDC